MHTNRTTEGQVKLERVEICFEHDWSKITKVEIKAVNYNEPKQWIAEDSRSNSIENPTNNIGFIAFLLACVKAANQGMPVAKVVMKDGPAATLFSVANSQKKWVNEMLVFEKHRKPAVRGSFFIHGRPPGAVTVELRSAFEVVVSNGAQTSHLSDAEDGLQSMFEKLDSKHSKISSATRITSSLKPKGLPPMRCHKWVSRPVVEKLLCEGLTSQKSVVWVCGEEGVGKSEAVRHVLEEILPTLHYQVVWIDVRPSDSVEAMDISKILAELGRKLGLKKLLPDNDPDLSLAAEELSQQSALIVLQRYEAVNNPQLFSWLASLDTCKTIIISCLPPRGGQVNFSHSVNIPPMTEIEREQYFQMLLNSEPSSTFQLSAEDKKFFFKEIGFNPQRVERASSLLKNGCVLFDLKSNTKELRPGSLEYFEEDSIKCLLALSLFPYGAYANEITEITGLSEDKVKAALLPLRGFVEVCRYNSSANAPPRWQLADKGTGNMLREFFKDSVDLKKLKNRWYGHFENMTSQICCCWNDLSKLFILDEPFRAETVLYVLEQAMFDKQFDSAIKIGSGCRYWQYVRGDWFGKSSPIQIWEDAARAKGDKHQLFDALVYKLNIRSKQAKHSKTALADAIKLESEIKALLKSLRPSKSSYDSYLHATALLHLARKNYRTAEKRWKDSLKRKLKPHDKSAMQRHLAVCLLEQEIPGKRDEARKILTDHLKYVERNKFERSALMAHLTLAGMDLADGKTEAAGNRLHEIEARIKSSKDTSFLADYEFYTAKFLLADTGVESAVEAFHKARSHYDRLGKDARVFEIDQIVSRLSVAA